MRVDQAGGDVTPAQIDRFGGGIARAHADNHAVFDGDFGGVNLAGKDIDQLQIGQQQIGGLLAARGGDTFG